MAEANALRALQRSRFTPAPSPIRPRARARRRSTRPRHSCSTTSITPPSLFGLQAFGNIYTRIGNPTCAVLEERVAALEGGTAGLAVASGHAAQVIVMHALMTPGDEFVASKKLYGGSINQFNHAYKNFGWNVVWADPDDIASFETADNAEDQRRSSSSRSPIPAASSPTSRRFQRSRARPACRSSSTTRWRRPTSASRSSTAPTSSCIR